MSRIVSRAADRLRHHRRPLLLAAAAAAAVMLPPVHFASRLDGAWYDLVTRWHLQPAPTDVVLVELSDPAWLDVLVEMAARERSRVLVTTLTQPPATPVGRTVLGPTVVPIGGPLLRRTSWPRGGHIEFLTGVDGRVRALPGWLDPERKLPALSLQTLQTIAGATIEFPSVAYIGFADPAGFRRLTPQDLQAATGLLADSIVIAGRPEPTFATPIGVLAPHEIVAQAVQSYRNDTLASTSALAASVPWTIVFATLALMLAGGARTGWRHWLVPASSTGLSLGVSVAALTLAQVWMPMTAAQVFLLTAASLLHERTVRRDRPAEVSTAPEAERIDAALAAGDVEQAWAQIRAIAATRANLDLLCDCAAVLESYRYLELAADTYHRAARIDPYFRDCGRKLVRASRSADEHQPAVDAATAAAIPPRLGRYELLEPIGRGSTGVVYLAVDPEINRLVALKIINLRAEYDADQLEDGLERFRREAKSAGRLNHPSIVTIFDIGEQDGLAYIAMEYLKGRHLSHFTTTETQLPAALVLEIGARIADALDYAHEHGVVHRDIKPGNIMYDSVSGAVTITDFGIARLIDVSRTRTGVVLGTPSFMAPEQLEGKNVNRHTDLFALGVTLYELLTGRLPFLGASMTKLMFVIANEPHPPVTALRPDLPTSLGAVLDQALAKCPEDRYARGADMAAALRLVAAQIA